MKIKMPKFDDLMNPALSAIQLLGGSAAIDELYEKVAEVMNLSEEILQIPHEKSNSSEVRYRLAWALTYLKKYGAVQNSARGVWSFSPDKEPTLKVDQKEVVRVVRDADRRISAQKKSVKALTQEEVPGDEETITEEEEWRAQVFEILTKSLSPAAFERLVQRLLRESGFIKVEVTGRSGDGGIDGKGIAKIHGLMSFHVVFQCKRYTGQVSPSQIRDFRGAMVGRADKGLFITTGSFSREAMKEATRDGATPVDLLDGDELMNKLKELHLGIRTELREEVFVEQQWFEKV